MTKRKEQFNSRFLLNQTDIQSMRDLIHALSDESTVVDFEEVIQTHSVQKKTRLWFSAEILAAFAYVDSYNNLWFEIANGFSSEALENAIVDWGIHCVKNTDFAPEESLTLDASCLSSNTVRLHFLAKHGFIQDKIRSMHYERDAHDPVPAVILPKGFSIRATRGKQEVESLVALHYAANQSSRMTVEYRLAMMDAPAYDPRFDWVVESPTQSLVAFCIGSFDEKDKTVAFLDPIGCHPDYQRQGLASALMNYGIQILAEYGANFIRFGTSSQNQPMQKLGEKLGFVCKSESLWFSLKVA